MMQAGRELDMKVAEALGLKPTATAIRWIISLRGEVIDLPHFSTTWEGMGELVEEAKKQGTQIEFASRPNEQYRSWVYKHVNGPEYVMCDSDSLPMAVCLAFLKARGVEYE